MGLLMFSSITNKSVACDGANEAHSSDDAEWGKFPGSSNKGNFGGDKMDLKTTVVTVNVDGGGTRTEKAARQAQRGCDTSRVVHTVVLGGVLIAFAVILALYVRELQTTDLIPTAPETCFEEECISRAAGKLRYVCGAIHTSFNTFSFPLSLWCV